MKKVFIVLLAIMLMLGACCALGEALSGPACAQVTADLLDAPNARANVLMRYYIGTRVEVIRDAGSGYVQVNVGEKGGSLMGYMEKRDLAFGEKEIRAVRAESVYYTAEAATVNTLYSYPDKQAPVIDTEFDIDYKQVLGYRSGEWLHVEDGLGGSGFVARDELKLYGPDYTYATFIYVDPAEDELSFEEAVEEGKARLLSDRKAGKNLNLGMDDLSAEGLEACSWSVKVLYRYDYPDTLLYEITFEQPGRLGAYAYINLVVDGKNTLEHNYGNG